MQVRTVWQDLSEVPDVDLDQFESAFAAKESKKAMSVVC